MRLLPFILGSIRVLDIRYTADGNYTADVWRCTPSKEPQAESSDLHKNAWGVTIVTVSGHGVITKPVGSDIAEKVRSDASTFIFSEKPDVFSFVRREQLLQLTEELAAKSIYPLAIECALSVEQTADKLYRTFRLRDLIRIDMRGSALGQAIARKIMPPLLGLLFLLLAINALVAPRILRHRQELQTETKAIQKDNAQTVSLSEERKQIMQRFARRIPVGYAELCDRIGSCVPERVMLTELAVEPLAKRLEEGKPLVRNERQAAITGYAESSSEIGRFSEALTAIPVVNSVKLVSVERVREGGLQFKIEIGL